MPNQQLARGLWAQFATQENPFGVANGMEQNLRHIDDHLALYTLLPPQAPGTPLPGDPFDGDGQVYTDGSYATFNGGTWRTYAPRRGIRVVLVGGTESWLNSGVGWEQFSVVNTGPAVAAALAAAIGAAEAEITPLVQQVEAEALSAASAVDAAFAEATAAQAARTGAESARDAALIQAGVFVDEPTGRAAVLDGQAFKVQGAGDVAAYEYRRVSASSSTLISIYPASQYVAAVDWKVQNQQARIGRPRVFGGEVSNGAQFWTGTSTSGATAASGGFYIPAGSSGNASYIRLNFNFTTTEMAQFAGRKVRFYAPLKTSVNFVSTGWFVAVQKQGSATIAGVVPKFEKIDSTTWIFWFEHTLVGDETVLSAYFQRSSSATFAEAFSVWAKGLYMMPQDDAGFREAVQASIGVDLTTVSAQADWKDWGRYAEAWPKIELPRSNQGEISNGAQWWNGSAVESTNPGGLKIPAGSTGVNSYLAWNWVFTSDDRANYAGKKFRIMAALKTTPDGLDSLTGMVQSIDANGTGGALGTVSNKKLYKVSSTLYLLSADYVASGSEIHVRMYYQRTSGAALASDFSMYTVGHFVVPMDVQGFSMAVDYYTAKLLSSSELIYTKTITVNPNGTGNYTTLAAAVAAEGGGTAFNRKVLYKVYEGIYTDTNYYLPNFSDVEGIGKRDQIWFKGYLPANSSLSTIENTQTFWMNQTTKIKNIKVTAQNMRYPIHTDSGASSYKAIQETEDCHIEHLGNEEARAYQQSIGQDPNVVWGSEHAWGCGTHSAQKISHRRTTLVSRTSPLYFHTNKDFAKPSLIELDDSQVICTTATGGALYVQCLGSGTPDRLVIRGSKVQGRLIFSPLPMLSQQPYNYRGNMNSEVEVFISGSSPVAWSATNYANVLELRSIDAVGSSVVVAGSGADALFGVVPEYQYGGSGFAARVYSAHAIYCNNGFVGIGLGARLGDCTTNNKILNIVFDGSISKTITLNQDFTSQSNATIIATLNTLLGDSAGRAFAEVNPYDGVAKVYQMDRELTLQNNSTVVILKGQAVAFDGSRRLCRRATSLDARHLVAGIALENIAPGRFGRVQKDGQFMTQQLRFSGTTSLAFGDAFGVSATAGDLVEGATVPLLRVIEAGSHPVYELI